MKRLLLVLCMTYGLVACGVDVMASTLKADKNVHSFMPDNDLYLEDGQHFLDANITKTVFDKIITIAINLYTPTAQKWGERLTIKRNWSDPTVNAYAWRDGRGNTEIMMYGGMARRPEVIPTSFALVLCHELNHLYGGKPYIEVSLKMAAEGQSDYAGAGWCLRNITEQLKDTTPFTVTSYMKKSCGTDNICLQRLGGSNGLGQLLAHLNEDQVPRFETPDNGVVTRTELSYPKTTQCRLDTYFNAVMGKVRPRCWFKN